jgi:hypothetical protein
VRFECYTPNLMGDTMHSRSNIRSRLHKVVRGIVATLLVPAGLCHSTPSQATEPWTIPLESVPEGDVKEEKSSEQVIEGGVAATMLFATLGLGSGVIAAALDAESERKRSEPCRSCPGGYNDLQRDMAMVANVSLVSFVAAGVIGVATTLYAATVDEEPKSQHRAKAPVRIRASGTGIVISF